MLKGFGSLKTFKQQNENQLVITKKNNEHNQN